MGILDIIREYRGIEELMGKVLSSVQVSPDNDEIIFTVNDGTKYKMWHQQDCCEDVSIDDIEGDLSDLIDSPVTQAEEVTSNEQIHGKPEWYDSFTWTFYKLATAKGYVTIRWLGESNGYYSESVEFTMIET